LIQNRKINGRLCEPPTKWRPKNRKVWFWCGYTTLLELTLSEIPEKNPASVREIVAARSAGGHDPPRGGALRLTTDK